MSEAPRSALRIDRAMITRRIEQIDMPADLKLLLISLADKTIEIGGKLYDIGARILAFILKLAKSCPGIAFGVVVALVLSYLINIIPLVGPLLSPILTPLLLIVGVSVGALDDLINGGMRARLQVLESELKAAGVA